MLLTSRLYSQVLSSGVSSVFLKKLFPWDSGVGELSAQQVRSLVALAQDPGLVLRSWGPDGSYPHFQFQGIQDPLLTYEGGSHPSGTYTFVQPKHFYTEIKSTNCLV